MLRREAGLAFTVGMSDLCENGEDDVALCKLTSTWPETPEVFVNPNHVIAIFRVSAGTRVITTGMQDGSSISYVAPPRSSISIDG